MLSAFATVTNRGMVSFPLSAPGALRPPDRRRSRPAVLLVPARYLLTRREPHAALAAHERDEILDQGDPRGAAADERMARQHEAAVLAVHRGELLAPHLQHAAWIGDRVGRAVDVPEQRRVVHDP